jgi:hemerythrin
MSETIQELQAKALGDQNRNLTGLLLCKLAHVTQTHFALEEEMMAATRYPELALHCLNHQRMMERLRSLVACHKRGSLTLNGHSLGFLSEWHGNHVEDDDLSYGLWLNRFGTN